MNYDQALAFLAQFIKSRGQVSHQGPGRMQGLMQACGHPHLSYPVLHITGTKGKGSVAAMLASILEAAGYRAGLYTSPHLQDFRERFKVNKRLIEPDEVVALVQQNQALLAQHPQLSWFEVLTALAFHYFQAQSVDIAIIEVGIGGRADATNVVDPVLSVITSLSYDHTEILGPTLAQIANETAAGVIKPGRPLISAPQAPPAQAVLESLAQELAAPLWLLGRDWHYQTLAPQGPHEDWLAGPVGQDLTPYQTRLLGPHQAINGTLALATVAQLNQLGWTIPPQAQRAGLRGVNWPGRMEVIGARPSIVLDGAHNAASAEYLAATLAARFPGRLPVLVFGAKADKDIGGMLAALLLQASAVVITQAGDAWGENPEFIAHLARASGYGGPLQVKPSLAEALQAAEVLAGPEGLICVTGSLYLVGEARNLYDLPIGQMAMS
jgi:dihydrofolate synthase/folylpolyglutamate synthase